MFDNLSAGIQPATEEEILSIFGDETDENLKNSNDDKTKAPADKKEVKKKPVEKKSTSSTENTDLVTKKNTLTDFSEEDDNAFESEEDDTDDDENKEDLEDKNLDDADENDDEDKEADKKKEGNEDEDSIKDFIKARAEFLIKKGEWVDFEGREDIEWDEDEFARVELEQRNFQKQQITEEVLDSFGPVGREIATFTQNGGNPDDLLDIFKEQQRVENFQIDSEDGQKAIILKYETEFVGKKPERVKKYIDSLIADKELKEAAIEAKEIMETSLAEQAETLQSEQKAQKEQSIAKQKAAIQNFSNSVSKIINDDKSIPVEEKQQLIKVLTKYDKKLPNGVPVNDFYHKFAEFKKDLPNYVNFVRFVLNPDKFLKTIKTQGNNEATEKAFKLARTSNKIKKIKSKDTPTGSEKSVTSKFRLL